METSTYQKYLGEPLTLLTSSEVELMETLGGGTRICSFTAFNFLGS